MSSARHSPGHGALARAPRPARAIAAAGALLLAGCVTTNFTQPVATFKESVTTSSAAMGAYYTNLNEFERRLYTDDLAFDPTREVAEIEGGKPTPLLGEVFKPASIKARMDALALLAAYAERLTELTTSDAPDKLAGDTGALGEGLAGLDKTFADLKKTDPSAQQYVEPVAALAGAIGKLWLQQKIDADLAKVVADGSARVDRILDLLEKDLTDTNKPLQTTGLHERLANRIAYYNRMRRGWTAEQRQASLADLAATADAYEAALVFNPASVTGAIRDANHALLACATRPRTPRTFAELTAALRALEQSTREIVANVQKIADLMKGK